MRHLFRSESEAFDFLLVIVVAAVAIGVASVLGGLWAGVATLAAAMLVVALLYLRRGRRELQVRTAPGRAGPEDELRILVIANDAVVDDRLADEIERASSGHERQVRIVCPALTSRGQHWASDVDPARAEAQQRLDESLARLRGAGIEATGQIGDEDPLRAIEDALRTFGADEIIITTHPEQRASRLERGVVARARERYALPVRHLPAVSGPTLR